MKLRINMNQERNYVLLIRNEGYNQQDTPKFPMFHPCGFLKKGVDLW